MPAPRAVGILVRMAIVRTGTKHLVVPSAGSPWDSAVRPYSRSNGVNTVLSQRGVRGSASSGDRTSAMDRIQKVATRVCVVVTRIDGVVRLRWVAMTEGRDIGALPGASAEA
jgi:hypothetical protein